MLQFTLFKRPSRLVFLDDDPLFLQVLKVAIPPDWRADLFTDSQVCLSYLKNNGVAWLQDEYKQQILLDKLRDSPQIRQSFSGNGVIPALIEYWHQNPARYDFVHIATFDYAMPGLNGLDVFELLENWPGRRVLLTGQADESIAVQAFNQGLIQQFIAKQGGDLRESLLFQLPHLLAQPLPNHQFLWLQSLSMAQQHWLSEPTVVEALNDWVLQSDWIEYAVTSAPFGFLGVNAKGVVSWLQLAFESELEQIAHLASQQGLDSKGIEKISKGALLANTILYSALGDSKPIATSVAFKLGNNSHQCGQHGHAPDTLLGALWPLGANYDLKSDKSYDAWSADHPTQMRV